MGKGFGVGTRSGSRHERHVRRAGNGGHSGVEIDKGRLNGIVGLASFLKRIREMGIDYELASLEGGTAGNAIPPRARAVIVVDSADKGKIEQEMSTWHDELQEQYQGIEDSITCSVAEEGGSPQVLSSDDKDALVKLATEVIDGVHIMSPDMKTLVESSSNLGVFNVNQEGMQAIMVVRSSLGEKGTEILESHLALAQECGYDVEVEKQSDRGHSIRIASCWYW